MRLGQDSSVPQQDPLWAPVFNLVVLRAILANLVSPLAVRVKVYITPPALRVFQTMIVTDGLLPLPVPFQDSRKEPA